ncbi:hypothetical protein EV128_12593 [Rhizobium azibense]|nr:hypothetical protein EV128_12593 [Rhizobium azibense]
MSAPDFDKSIYELDSHEGDWALLLLRKDTGLAALAHYFDGDWELNDQGETVAMRKKYMRMVAAARTLNAADDDLFAPWLMPDDEEGTWNFNGEDVDLPDDFDGDGQIPEEPAKPVNPYANNPNYGRF